MATKKAVASKKASSNKKVAKKTLPTKAQKQTPIAIYQNWCKRGNRHPNISLAFAEFIGVFLLALAFLMMQGSPLFFGLSTAAIILIVGGISGAHLNPAVTFGAWVSRKINAKTAVFYIVGQILGAGAAWLTINRFMNGVSSDGIDYTSSILHSGAITGNEGYLFLVELLGAFILTLGFANVIRNKSSKITASLTGGLVTLIAYYVAMSLSTILLTESYTGLTFLNPALAFAANGLAFNWSLAIFILAPILGGLVAFAVSEFLHFQEKSCACDICEK